MKQIQKRSALTCLACLFGAFSFVQADDQFEPNETIIEEARVITESLTAVKPEQPRRVLIFGRSSGPHRNVIPTGRIVMKQLGELTGAYEADISEDPYDFESENLKKYDAVVFCNTTGAVFNKTLDYKIFKNLPKEERNHENDESDRLVANLLEFIDNGGGFFGIHAATDSLRSSKDFRAMIGGKFNKHPWTGNHQVVIRIEDPDHALIHEIWSDTEFQFCDEIYQFDDSYSRERQRVLMGLNLEKSDEPFIPLERDDGDYPITWVRQHGQGNVFYCSLGHRKETYAEAEVLELWLRGMQFVLGDLEAEVTPLPQPAP